eukprot:GHVN01076817.1.p1 GENE.GHVN01076817.1~~GHVN01076817.1.p1  ORF type:complete len:124 (+),score=5.98 GHVN01076817.1:841-1212(+)
MKGPLPTSARRHTHALVMIDHGETVAIAFHNFIICRCGWPGDPSTSETQRRGPPLQPRKLAGDGLDSAFTTLSPLWRPSPLWRCPTNQCALVGALVDCCPLRLEVSTVTFLAICCQENLFSHH